MGGNKVAARVPHITKAVRGNRTATVAQGEETQDHSNMCGNRTAKHEAVGAVVKTARNHRGSDPDSRQAKASQDGISSRPASGPRLKTAPTRAHVKTGPPP